MSCEKESVIHWWTGVHLYVWFKKTVWIICSLHITSCVHYTEGKSKLQAFTEKHHTAAMKREPSYATCNVALYPSYSINCICHPRQYRLSSNRFSMHLAYAHRTSKRTSTFPWKLKNPDIYGVTCYHGALNRTWTCDLPVNSRMLYQLSY